MQIGPNQISTLYNSFKISYADALSNFKKTGFNKFCCLIVGRDYS